MKNPESPWISRPVSVDMMKQFLTRQITEAVAIAVIVKTSPRASSGLNNAGAAVNEDDVSFHMEPGMTDKLCNLVCDMKAARLFLDDYAPVWQSPSDERFL